MKSRLWSQSLDDVVAHPYDWEHYRLFLQEARQLLDNIHPLLDAHVLRYPKDDRTLAKALWMLLNDALGTLRDSVELMQNDKHWLVGKMFRDLIEVLDITCYFHAQTPQSIRDLERWYDDQIISHSRYRDHLKKSLSEQEAKKSGAKYGNFSRWTHHTYRTLLNSYSLGQDDLLVYDSHAPELLVLPQTVSQYLWALGQLICKFLDVLRQVGFAGEDQISKAMAFDVLDKDERSTPERSTERKVSVKKIAFVVLGILLGLFGVAQGLQLLGLIGTKTFSIPGVGFTILGLALCAACLKKAFKSE